MTITDYRWGGTAEGWDLPCRQERKDVAVAGRGGEAAPWASWGSIAWTPLVASLGAALGSRRGLQQLVRQVPPPQYRGGQCPSLSHATHLHIVTDAKGAELEQPVVQARVVH